MSRDSHERTFQSREILWTTFESMARELDVPVDQLVNEAMEAYARIRGYAVAPASVPLTETLHSPVERRGGRRPQAHPEPLEETYDAPGLSALDRSYAPARPTEDSDDLARTAARVAARPPRNAGRGAMPAALGKMPGPSAPLPPPPPTRGGDAGRAPLSGGSMPTGVTSGRSLPPPPLPRRPGSQSLPPAPAPAPSRRLVLSYQNRTYAVDKDRFLIGRSKTQADLRLDDPNVSRQHAVIERVGSAWYIVDLGSTNGVSVAGERASRRAIAHGDVIVITTHEIHCSLR